ncbi:MAG TPA: carboxymuconolactone decarboxylase family protein [Pseudonocardiaceae bacterium]|jgi:AhpD family alkylhydroperoxidase
MMETGLPEGLVQLVGLRISQLNGCGEGVYGHHQAAKRAGETEERLVLIAAWRDAPFFTEAERAAFDLAEWLTVHCGQEHAGTRDPLRSNIFFRAFRNSP